LEELVKLSAGAKCISGHSELEEGNLAFILSIMQIFLCIFIAHSFCCYTHFILSNSIFFEKLRILESRDKSEARLRNEKVFPLGFSTKKSGTVVDVQNDTSDDGTVCI
jgi:hypothetical protein